MTREDFIAAGTNRCLLIARLTVIHGGVKGGANVLAKYEDSMQRALDTILPGFERRAVDSLAKQLEVNSYGTCCVFSFIFTVVVKINGM